MGSKFSLMAILCGSLSPHHGASSGCGWRQPPDTDGSCECIIE